MTNSGCSIHDMELGKVVNLKGMEKLLILKRHRQSQSSGHWARQALVGRRRPSVSRESCPANRAGRLPDASKSNRTTSPVRDTRSPPSPSCPRKSGPGQAPRWRSLSLRERGRVSAAGHDRAVGLPSPRASPSGRGGTRYVSDGFHPYPGTYAPRGVDLGGGDIATHHPRSSGSSESKCPRAAGVW